MLVFLWRCFFLAISCLLPGGSRAAVMNFFAFHIPAHVGRLFCESVRLETRFVARTDGILLDFLESFSMAVFAVGWYEEQDGMPLFCLLCPWLLMAYCRELADPDGCRG